MLLCDFRWIFNFDCNRDILNKINNNIYGIIKLFLFNILLLMILSSYPKIIFSDIFSIFHLIHSSFIFRYFICFFSFDYLGYFYLIDFHWFVFIYIHNWFIFIWFTFIFSLIWFMYIRFVLFTIWLILYLIQFWLPLLKFDLFLFNSHLIFT